MTLHYHGTPITPRAVLRALAGRSFCVSYAAPGDLEWCHVHGQSVMLDNGAFSIWRMVEKNKPIPARLQAASEGDWSAYTEWVRPWLDHKTTWAVIPDVIGGSEEDNDRLILSWPREFFKQSAPVWHMHESIERLVRLANTWERVCVGSSGTYSEVGDPLWCRRMDEAMNRLCGNGPPPCWLHMLRGMKMSEWDYPFASVDSTDVARNHNPGGGNGDPTKAIEKAQRWDARQCPARWHERNQSSLLEPAGL